MKRPRSGQAPCAPLVADPVASAKEAGLRHVSDAQPGIARTGSGGRWVYHERREGRLRRVTDRRTLERIERLVIPPAWSEVWICPFENGHLQATGRDARGRKQYRYHARWRKTRDVTKYEHLLAFARELPKIRRRVARDLKAPGLPKRKVVAAVVRLLEKTLIRVGNDEYVRANRSYGLTTFRNRHATVGRGVVTFDFRGKHGKQHRIDLHDPRLARVVRRCRELPGQELFCYRDEEGGVVDINSSDVNAYLREISGGELTTRDFRTWHGSVLAFVALRELGPVSGERQTTHQIAKAVEAVATLLGNTPTICRKCYIHPEVIEAYRDGSLHQPAGEREKRRVRKEFGALKADEIATVALLLRRGSEV